MAHYQLILAYDGTHFQGFQRQVRARSVQGEVERVLRQLGWQGKTILAAGRTDSGVHATGQVIAFDLDWAHPPDDLLRAMNANLPPDIAVQQVRLTHSEFHPRYAARQRTYEYWIFIAEARHPLRERYAWRVYPAPAVKTLNETARWLLGGHDFRAFGSPIRTGGSTHRVLFAAEWQSQGDTLRFEVTGNAFLYRMVRRMVFLQVITGQGLLSLAEFQAGVANAHPLKAGLAPAQGLVLKSVTYEADNQESKRCNPQ